MMFPSRDRASRAFVLAMVVAAAGFFGCSGGTGGGGGGTDTPPSGGPVAGRADAVDVTYYYLPG